ncbi:hypothetical protein [Ancylobacter sp. G4_0304]|uniref:hypothetical protein n=1 Tax=Ancylobacter sp. G4_0304 TaxID=3114289 RepID=UPI0039C7204A
MPNLEWFSSGISQGCIVREAEMTNDLKKLIEAAKRVEPTAEHREQQRRSFAYGNTSFENDRITRDMVNEQAEKLARQVRDGQ